MSNGWRDWDCVPKDGSEFLVYENLFGKGLVEILKFSHDKFVVTWNYDEYEVDECCFWQPLPKGPNE